MYKVSENIEEELQKRYPYLRVGKFIHDLIELIVDETLNTGQSTIRSFGRFSSYKSFSGKLKKDQIRFKFKVSQMFEKDIKNDNSLLSKIKTKTREPFTEEHQEKCKKGEKILSDDLKSKI